MVLPPVKDAPVENAEEICTVNAELYLFNPIRGTFQLQAKEAKAQLVSVGPFECK
jgi:hypothetical protein